MQAPPALGPAALRPAAADWRASLRLNIGTRHGRSTLIAVRHLGPLRVQKPLYPEGDSPLHLLLVHPPGGIAGGDALGFDIEVGGGAHALLTTPGAGKWYRANGRPARQQVQLHVHDGAALEWLPQETIHFNGCDADQRLRLDCGEAGRACGWDVSVLGRRASAERFLDGRLRQRIELRRGGQLWWSEQAQLAGGDALLTSPVGWDGMHVSGLFWALGVPEGEALVEACQAIAVEAPLRFGVTCPREGLLLARALGDSPERVRQVLAQVWACVRPALLGRAAVTPRIWAT